jgi:hypothetical protein
MATQDDDDTLWPPAPKASASVKAVQPQKPITQWAEAKKMTGDWRYVCVLGSKVQGYECTEEEFDAQVEAAGKVSLR